ncbi:glycosyltransferase family 2 protein [Candidatus Daviesbacteria bacterium]|nr:glycosyltransferase family 2 protein [Candidatus Daviesbacteria bacterium]
MKKLAVVIAARNEEKVLPHTLWKLTRLIKPENIYLVSDGSTDQTVPIAKFFNINLLENRQNIGKTLSSKKALDHFKILNHYRYVFLLDADTVPGENFFNTCLKRFSDKRIAGVCGQVVAQPKFNLLVVYRTVMYHIWQNFYKQLTSWINAVTIAPGTATIYKTSVVKNLDFDGQLIIEDFDFTYQIYRKNLGLIKYEPKAEILTQDPDNLTDYFKQNLRWTVGFLQSAIKHKIPLGFKPFELLTFFFSVQDFLHLAGLVFLILLGVWLLLFSLYPSLLGVYIEQWVVLYILILDIVVIMVFGLISLIEKKRFKEILLLPFIWFVQFIHLGTFIYGVYQTLFKHIKNTWVSPKRRK